MPSVSASTRVSRDPPVLKIWCFIAQAPAAGRTRAFVAAPGLVEILSEWADRAYLSCELATLCDTYDFATVCRTGRSSGLDLRHLGGAARSRSLMIDNKSDLDALAQALNRSAERAQALGLASRCNTLFFCSGNNDASNAAVRPGANAPY